ncbi:unnamed protein product [Calicophoron daubneyi]|uniref:SAC3/GANP/THP3 conserved domain-containing protein n=1 Tax=Calicophoron daubneyi TaxID=300641 RepID=A0AAV2TU78_CALDB
MAQQWNAYANYWQCNPYGAYYDYGHAHSAQTYDYNHQGSARDDPGQPPSTPPPPGLESEKGPGNSSLGSPHVPATSSWTQPYPPGPYSNPGPPPPYRPFLYRVNSQRPLLPAGGMPPAYPAPSMLPATQIPGGWGAPSYGYPPYQQSPSRPAPPFYPQPWRFEGAPPPQPGGFTSARPRYPGNSADLRASGPNATTAKSPDSLTQLKEPPAALKAKGTDEHWSDELKDYVQRAFCSIDTPEEKDQMERILKEKLEYIFRNNIKIDWTKENIPTIPSKAIRNFTAAPRQTSVNLVRPIQLPGPRGARTTGPARGGFLRLPTGMLAKSGRNVFSAANMNRPANNKRIMPSRSRSRSRSPAANTDKSWSRRRSRKVSRSRSRSISSKSSESRLSTPSSSDSRFRPQRPRREGSHSRSPSRSRSRSRSISRRSSQRQSENTYPEYSSRRSPSPPVAHRGRKQRRKRRGGRGSGGGIDNVPGNNNPTTKDDQNFRGHGRGRRGGRGAAIISPGTSATRLSMRANRFKDHLGESSLAGSGSIARTTSQMLLNFMDDRDELAADFEACQIVGTMQELEKPYLRLTRAPDPSEVRPLAVLKQSLEHVKQKWVSKSDYHWVCEQFKSIRQDLTVQGIEDEFAISVYEAHADAALDAGDFEEFHQCQSQLLRLYNEGNGSARILEFTAYRLLYYIFTLDILGINTIMAGLRPGHKSNPCIRFALDVRSAWSLRNYRRFFRLVCPASDAEQQPPLRCGLVVNWFIDRERREAAKIMFKVFRPSVALSFAAESFGFSSADECKSFLCEEFSLSNELFESDKLDGKAVWSAMCQGS